MPTSPETTPRFAAVPRSPAAPPGDPAEAALLARCARFRSLDEHAETVCRALGVDPRHRDGLHRALERMRREGRLVSEAEVVRRVAGQATAEDRSGTISTIGFVTRDRPDTVARGALSYASHARRHGHPVRIVVMDDGHDGAAASALASVAPNLDAPLHHAGPGEKERFVSSLVEAGAGPRDVVEFALLDPFRTGSTYGANRNALFLETLGELILSADDDTLLRAFRPDGETPGLAVSGGRPPVDFWFFPDLAAGMEQVGESTEDFLDTLHTMLGRPAANLFAESVGAVDLTRVGSEVLARLLTDAGRVVAVMPGMLGDAGGESPLYHLLSARGESHRAMVGTWDSYRMSTSSRDHLRAVRTPALSRGGYLMSTAIAFDVRDPLPPFFPVFRCEDNLYGDILKWCRPHDWIGHVPTSLVHAPERPRKYSSNPLGGPGSLLPLSALAALAMSGAPLAEDNPEDRQRALGRLLVEMAGSTTLEAELRGRVHRSLRERVRYVRSCQLAHADSPAWWHRDMDQHVAAMEGIPQNVSLTPAGLGSFEDVRTLFDAYGRLLEAWPDIWHAARELRARGIRPAVPLQG